MQFPCLDSNVDKFRYEAGRGDSPPPPIDDAGRRARNGAGDPNFASGWDIPPGRRHDDNEGLQSYKQFMLTLPDDISPAESERRYDEYKTQFVQARKREYFERNRKRSELREKYDPVKLEEVWQRKLEKAQAAAVNFIKDLEEGTLRTGPLEGDEDRRRDGDRRILEAPAIASDPQRIQLDIKQCTALIKQLDVEKSIAENKLIASVEASETGAGAAEFSLDGDKLLDALLTYLWQVHFVDYYGGLEARSGRGDRQHRSTPVSEVPATPEGTAWEQKIDSFWQARLKTGDPIEALLGRDKVQATVDKGLEAYTKKTQDAKYGWKYGCGAQGCTKLFHGPDFVLKHLKAKHPSLVEPLKERALNDVYFANYLNDPNAPVSLGPPPSKGNQAPRDRGPSRRDEPGGRRPMRDRLGPGIADERDLPPRELLERDLPPPPARGPGGRAGPPPARGFTPPRGAFRGPGMEGPPFDDRAMVPFDDPRPGKAPGDGYLPRDRLPPPLYDDEFGPGRPVDFDGPMFDDPYARGPGGPGFAPMPQVLIPVPGAGPLGPFVPAPPDVARRILAQREAGGIPLGPGPVIANQDFDDGFIPDMPPHEGPL